MDGNRVEVDVSSGRHVVGDGRSVGRLAVHADGHGSGTTAEGHLKVVDPVGGRGVEVAARAGDADLDIRLAHGERHDGDDILGAVGRGLAAALSPDGAAVPAQAGGGGAVPGNGPGVERQGDVLLAGFVGLDEVGQDGAEGGVVVAVDVLVGALDDLLADNVGDVARLAKVVPGDDLDGAGEHVEDLLPSVVPEGLAGGVPVLAPLGEVWGKSQRF